MVIMFGVCFIGEDVGWVNFDQVIGEFVFQCIVFWMFEVDVVMCVIDVQIGVVGIIFVVMYIMVIGDVVVYFVRDEWFQILVVVGMFGEMVVMEIVVCYYGYILKMVVIVFFIDWIVVWVVSYQLFYYVFMELFCFFVVNRDKGIVGGWCYIGYYQVIMCIFCVLVLFYCILVVSIDVFQCWVLVKIWNIKVEGQICLQQVVCVVDFVFFVVYMNCSYQYVFKLKIVNLLVFFEQVWLNIID